MPFHEEGDLDQAIEARQGQPFELDQVASFFMQLCEAILYIHRRNIIHRDVKPKNVLMANGGSKVVLADFGIVSVAMVETTASSMTKGVGTLGFSAPELFGNEEDNEITYDAGVDVFSLGSTIFTVANLKRPFSGNQMILLRKLLVDKKKDAYEDFCSPEMREVIDSCMTFNSKKRPSIDMVMQKLEDKFSSQLTKHQITMLKQQVQTLTLENSKQVTENDQLKTTINQLNKKLDETEEKKNSLQKSATEWQKHAESVKYQRKKVEAKNEKLEKDIKRLTDEAETNRAELDTLLHELHSTVFACGENEHNRLGIESNDNQRTFVQTNFGAVKKVDANFKTCVIDMNDQLWINGVKYLEGTKIKSATSAAGADDKLSYFAVDADDKVWSWGEGNGYGQLGNGTKDACATPKMIEALKDETIKQFEVYSNRVACVTTDNVCYIWGACLDAFGFGKKVTTPRKLDRRIEQISLGYDHAMMIESNCVYSIGANSCGHLGVGDFDYRAEWTKVGGLEGETIKMVQCGDRCSAILTDKSLFVMGKFLNGAEDDKVNVPTKIDLSNITKISLKGAHILAINDEGTVFSWGYNEHERCGVGSSADQITTPTRVPIPASFIALDISAGFRHSAIKCCKK